jgi:7-carboxy-7-deazaguanine synthase
MRLLEHYVSTQGEGPRVGVPTQFVRFAGCNLKCPGWPCDTPFAIDPKLFMKEQMAVSPEALVEACHEMASVTGAENICLTGGEPLLQPFASLNMLVEGLHEHNLSVEMFTNGTYLIPTPLLDKVSFTMDWKLRGSGEDLTHRQVTRTQNIKLMDEATKRDIVNAVKFVCKDKFDLEEAIRTHCDLGFDIRKLQAFFGVVWDGEDLTTAELVEELLGRNVPNWRLNVQVHNFIWPAHERAR